MPIPTEHATVNPFVICDDADGLIRFLVRVLDAVENDDVRTHDEDGRLFHAELQIRGSMIMFAERKPGWPYTPALTQVYVEDVAAVLDRARAGGAEVVTEATPFFGSTIGRFLDGWGNLWWLFAIPEDAAPGGDGAQADEGSGDEGSGWDEGSGDEGSWWDEGQEMPPELRYVSESFKTAVAGLRDPRSRD